MDIVVLQGQSSQNLKQRLYHITWQLDHFLLCGAKCFESPEKVGNTSLQDYVVIKAFMMYWT